MLGLDGWAGAENTWVTVARVTAGLGVGLAADVRDPDLRRLAGCAADRSSTSFATLWWARARVLTRAVAAARSWPAKAERTSWPGCPASAPVGAPPGALLVSPVAARLTAGLEVAVTATAVARATIRWRIWPAAGQMRHRIVALATAVAVTATSSPAVSLAATGLTSNAPGGAPTGADAGQPGHDVRSALAGHDLAAATARVKTRARAHHKVAKLVLDLSAAHPAKRRKSGSRTSAAKPTPSPAVTRATVTHVFSAPAQPSSPNICPPKARSTYAHAAAGNAKRVTATHSLARRLSAPAGCSNHTTTAPNHGPPSPPPATTVTSTGPASTTPNVPTTTPSPPPATTAPTSPSPPPATTAPPSPSPTPAATAPTSPPNQPVTTSPSEPPANRPVS